MSMSKILSQLNPKDLFNNVKQFFMDTFKELDLDKASVLKPGHQEKFRKLRLRYINLIGQARDFSENAIPPLKWSIEQLKKVTPAESTVNKEVDSTCPVIKILSELVDEMDPSTLLDECTALERDVIAFNDEIKLDPSYKGIQWRKWRGIILGGITIIGAIALVVVMPWALPLEIAIITGAAVGGGATIAAIMAIKNGFSAGQLESDIQELALRLKAANGQVGSIKEKLSEMLINQGHIKIRLGQQDLSALMQYYSDMLANVRDIHRICARPLVDF